MEENEEIEVKEETGETQAPRTFTQEEVNELMGKTRQEARERVKAEAMAEAMAGAMKELLGKYGVETEEELDGIFGRGQAYDVLNDDYTNQGNDLRNVRMENALLKSGISQNRWEDAKAILNNKGLEITEDNIASELATHPEWSPAPATPAPTQNTQEAPSVLKKMGMDITSENGGDEMSEDDQINKWFGIGGK